MRYLRTANSTKGYSKVFNNKAKFILMKTLPAFALEISSRQSHGEERPHTYFEISWSWVWISAHDSCCSLAVWPFWAFIFLKVITWVIIPSLQGVVTIRWNNMLHNLPSTRHLFLRGQSLNRYAPALLLPGNWGKTGKTQTSWQKESTEVSRAPSQSISWK